MADMGRPKVEIDMDQLAGLCRMKPTLADCAAFFKCCEDTVENRIKEHTGLTFSEFRDQNMVHTRFNLVREALKKAKAGDNTMLIFCLKNICKWSDRADIDLKSSDGSMQSTVNITIPSNGREKDRN